MVQIFISLKEKTLAIPLCLGNVSNHISADNMKKTGFMDMFTTFVFIMMLFQLMIY